MELDKFKGIFPALYACYDDEGEVSKERTQEFVKYLKGKGIHGLYVGGSSGECIYQNLEERKKTLKYAIDAADKKLTLIAHVGALSTRDSIKLAKYAEELGYDALSSIPPIYYGMSEKAIKNYWIEIVNSTNLPFFIYNIPQTTGYNLSIDLFMDMIKNDKVKGIKNSSMPTMDIERFKKIGGNDFIIFNGPDEQYIAGRLMGADSGIGGTYGAMPELFLKAEEFIVSGEIEKAREIQNDINDIIMELVSQDGSLYSTIKKILKIKGVNIGSVRKPLQEISDSKEVEGISNLIDKTIDKYRG